MGPTRVSEGARQPASTAGPAEGHAQHRSILGGARLGPVNRRCLALRCRRQSGPCTCLAVEPSRERLSRLTIPSCSLFQVQCTCERARSLCQCCLCSNLKLVQCAGTSACADLCIYSWCQCLSGMLASTPDAMHACTTASLSVRSCTAITHTFRCATQYWRMLSARAHVSTC